VRISQGLSAGSIIGIAHRPGLLDPADKPRDDEGELLLKFQEKTLEHLHFHITGLNAYWTQKKPGGMTKIFINNEAKDLPYAGNYILYIAAEWLCFRMLEIINQLH
jgi:hypothetical protein